MDEFDLDDLTPDPIADPSFNFDVEVPKEADEAPKQPVEKKKKHLIHNFGE